MHAARSHEHRAPHRSRLLHGPEWVSPYAVRRAALQRVTRSEPVEFLPSRGVILLGGTDDARAGDGPAAPVVDLTARRVSRAAKAEAAAARHPSRWQPA